MAEQEFDALRPEDRPQDSSGDGEGLRFTTHEHDEMNMPQAIEVMDAEGRWAVYVPLKKNGEDRAAKTASGESGIRLEAERGQRLGAGTPPPLPNTQVA